MTVRELIAQLQKVEDDVAEIVLILNGQEINDFTIEDHSAEDDPFVSMEGDG